jgi:hypothetical protein
VFSIKASLASAALVASAAVLPAPMLAAQDCGGDAGYGLGISPTVALGTQFTIEMTAPGNSVAFLLVGGSQGPINTKFGSLCVGFPFVAVYAIPMPASGSLTLPHDVPCNPDLDGMTGYFQFVALGPAQGQYGRSNMQSLTAVDDGSCNTGNFVTFTQGGWGTACSGSNPGCIRDEHFEEALPGGLLLGDQDGIDGDNHFALLLTTSLAVQNLLPEGGGASALDLDQTDVSNASGGVFTGQLAAAKLNVAYDDAGAFDFMKDGNVFKLGNLVYVSGAHAKLIGWTLRDVIDLADRAISGELAAPIDVDNDGFGDVTLLDLSSALDAVNNNYDNGTQNNGVLAHP